MVTTPADILGVSLNHGVSLHFFVPTTSSTLGNSASKE